MTEIKLYQNRNWLNKKYLNDKLSINQIAELCNCNHVTIWNWLIKLNIKIRSKNEAIHLIKANHCRLSEEVIEWIDGELLGDGCLVSRSKYSARFFYTSKYLKYAEYIRDTLNSFGIKQIGKINKQYHKKYSCYTYRYTSRSYVELLPIFKQWYPEPMKKKIIPRNIKLTSLTLRQEYIGDGHLRHQKGRKPFILLSTCGFLMKDVEWLVSQLNKLGFISTRQPASNTVYISGHSTKQFLSYIGICPIQCYQYKWSY